MSALKRFFLLFALLLLLGCSSLPVQEMSDARLTIRAAYDAGGPEYAAESLGEAEVFLQRASQMLEEHNYTQARYFAVQAQEKAATARDIAMLRAEGK